ncbi:MAG: ABC transporter ATP-binding protein [Candidatus Kariarchaeaceae archaeon]|jgi:ABC-type multidrug transport system fused ATPase/permease subunit
MMSHGRGRGPMGGFGEKQSRNRSSKKLIGLLWGYLGVYKIPLLVSGGLILIYTLGSIVSPLIIAEGLDRAKENPLREFLLLIFAVFLTLTLLTWIFNSLNTWLLARVNANFLNDIRVDVFDRLVNADMSYHHREKSGDVTSRLTGDTQELATGVTVINPIITGIALLAIPVAAILAGILGTLGRKIMFRLRRSYGAVSGQMAENLAGISVAKSFNREEWSSAVLYDLNQKTYNYFKQLGAIFNFMFPAVSMVSATLVAITLVAGGNLSDITIGTLYLATIMVQRFLCPVLHITMYYPQIQSSLAAMDRVADVLEQKPKVTEVQSAYELKLENTSVTFDNVSFEYIKNTKVLEDVTLDVNDGEKLAIVGHTGAGKTTLAALISRFYDPIEGRIMIGNQDIKEVTLSSLHKAIGLIPQEPYLFADTVIENIRYGSPNTSDEEILDLCKLIGADDFIEALPEGYDTKLKESGKGLSSGQRQMITIARTLLADPKILVLDEATSRLDAYSESLVQAAQQALFKGRTTFVIAHRLTTIRDVNRIAVFDKGKLVELGSHKKLLDQNGVYAELYNTYYKHQGVEKLTEVYMAPQKDSSIAIPEQMRAMMEKRGMTPDQMRAMMAKHGKSSEDMSGMIKGKGPH